MQPTNDNTTLIRLKEVMRRTGMSRSFLYQATADGAFPRFYKIGRATCWSASSVETWIADRLAGVALVTKAA